mmetsp:Transcript_26940/g.4953  ORF Transcript_26940/g.4953 Transcript_26940/m.4953 type:complete len:109 (-) Transcript_26940:1209-1535(-)
MKRGSKQGQELKDLSLKLIQASIMNQSGIFIERGAPSKVDEFRLVFYIAGPPTQKEDDVMCYKFWQLFEIPISQKSKVDEAKDLIIQKIQKSYPSIQITKDRLRIREK